MNSAFQASEALWANEGVGEIGEQEEGHRAAENIVEGHLALLKSKTIAGFGISQREGDQHHADPEKDQIHRRYSLLSMNPIKAVNPWIRL